MTDSGSHPSDDAACWARLTDKQRACLDLLLAHQTSKQIARHLSISKQAVDLRLTTARRNLGADSRAEAAVRYARLKQTYDRISCDAVILAPQAELLPSDFPDGESAALALAHSASLTERADVADAPTKGLWRHDHPRLSRAWIMAAMFVALVLLILAGVTIGETLTRLISG